MLICAGYMERFGIVVAIVLLLSVSDVDDCDDVDSAAAGIGNAVSVDDNNVADCQPFCFCFCIRRYKFMLAAVSFKTILSIDQLLAC